MIQDINEEILFTEEECNQILNEHTEFTRSIATDTSHIENEDVKKNLEDWRTSYDSQIPLSDSTKKLLLSKLEKYNIIDMDDVSIVVRYEVGQQFKPHRDSEDGYSHRYRTMVIQLSSDDDYEGGDLKIWDKNKNLTIANKTRGNVAIFNSDLLHEATPILKGTRYIWITWLRRNHFKIKNTII